MQRQQYIFILGYNKNLTKIVNLVENVHKIVCPTILSLIQAICPALFRSSLCDVCLNSFHSILKPNERNRSTGVLLFTHITGLQMFASVCQEQQLQHYENMYLSAINGVYLSINGVFLSIKEVMLHGPKYLFKSVLYKRYMI